MRGFTTVIFDLDGVLTDTARYHYFAWKQLADELGIDFNERINERLKGIDRMSSLEIILEKSRATYTLEEKLALAGRKNNYYVEMVKTMTPGDALPGAVSLLEELRKKGIKIGLASVSKNAPLVIERLGIASYFDAMADPQRITQGKPDPEIFLTVMQTLDSTPKQCIGIEDAVAGVQAIKRAGMFAIGVGNPDLLVEADEVISDLTFFRTGKYFP
ncbi:MAG TPA: beta-phosphoglucomutase [Bacillota bacterium]|nr:beta-phosphoglucomutase [Bacillota bacterium]